MKKNKTKIIAIVVTSVFAVLVSALAVWFFVFRVGKVSIDEYYEGITWDLTATQARNILLNDGYKIQKEGTVPVFDVESFGGYEGANGRIGLIANKDDKLGNILISFSDESMDVKKLNKFFKACTKELESQFDKKLDMVEFLGTEYSNRDEECSDVIYMGENSCIELIYYEDRKIMIVYTPADDEYCQELLRFAK